jgi:transposase
MPATVVAETAPTVPAAPARGRMVIVIVSGRRIIVDAGVDAVALARVLEVLERRFPSGVKVTFFADVAAI